MASLSAASQFRRTIWLAGLVFLLTFAAVGGLATTWFRAAAEPRVLLLGSGDALSVLVTAGSSRLLIVSGENTTDFGNALDAALPPTVRRIDVLLVAGGARDAAVAAHVLGAREARYRAVIGAPSPSISSSDIDTLTASRRFQMGRGVSVTVEISPASNADDRSNPPRWRAIIKSGTTNVVILSSGEDVAQLRSGDMISALVIVRGQPASTLADINVQAIVLSEEVARLANWREAFPRGRSPDLVVLPVANGEAKALHFVNRSLHLPDEAQPLPTLAPSSPV